MIPWPERTSNRLRKPHEMSFRKLLPIFLVTSEFSAISFFLGSLHILAQTISIMRNRKCIIKVRAKSKSADFGPEKTFLAENVKNVRDFFAQFNIEQLVIFLFNYTSQFAAINVEHIFFVARCGLRIILFYLRKIFHTPPAPGNVLSFGFGFGRRAPFFKHEMKSSYIILFLSPLSDEIKFHLAAAKVA